MCLFPSSLYIRRKINTPTTLAVNYVRTDSVQLHSYLPLPTCPIAYFILTRFGRLNYFNHVAGRQIDIDIVSGWKTASYLIFVVV